MTDSVALAFAPQLIHTMLHVRDLTRALQFYCGTLGMREKRRIEFPQERYTLVFIGYANAPAEAELELRHDRDPALMRPAAEALEHPQGAYGHLGIAVRDLAACVEALRSRGVRIRREPGPMRPGGRAIALIEDPEGNEVELLAAL
jgi:lactoylglutathione lyase